MYVDVVFGLPRRVVENLVVVDVFRSSTSIVMALENGAEEIIPCPSIEKARSLKKKLGDRSLLVGERRGITPRGFDLNISPSELTRGRVEGKKIIYCSTNLVKAVSKGMTSKLLIIGGLVNAGAVAAYLNMLKPSRLMIVACGLIPDKLVTLEDVIGAGAIVSKLDCEELSDTALLAKLVYENDDWRKLIFNGYIAKYLEKIGWEKDIEVCLKEDSSKIVPLLSKGVIKGIKME